MAVLVDFFRELDPAVVVWYPEFAGINIRGKDFGGKGKGNHGRGHSTLSCASPSENVTLLFLLFLNARPKNLKKRMP